MVIGIIRGLITSMITDLIGRHEVLLPINHKNYFQNYMQNVFAGCQVASEKQVLCQSKTQPWMNNAQLCRTLQK